MFISILFFSSPISAHKIFNSFARFISIEDFDLITRYGEYEENVILDKLGSEKWAIKKNKIREKLTGNKNPSAKKVQCIETGEIFDTIKQAGEWCHIGHSDIAALIRGKQKSAGKHPSTGEKLHWKYVE